MHYFLLQPLWTHNNDKLWAFSNLQWIKQCPGYLLRKVLRAWISQSEPIPQACQIFQLADGNIFLSKYCKKMTKELKISRNLGEMLSITVQ